MIHNGLKLVALTAALSLAACSKKKPEDLPPPPIGADGSAGAGGAGVDGSGFGSGGVGSEPQPTRQDPTRNTAIALDIEIIWAPSSVSSGVRIATCSPSAEPGLGSAAAPGKLLEWPPR